GVVEKVATTERKLAPLGHTMTAAESELAVAVQGVSHSAPMVKAQAQAVADSKEMLGTHATHAMKKVQNGMLMPAEGRGETTGCKTCPTKRKKHESRSNHERLDAHPRDAGGARFGQRALGAVGRTARARRARSNAASARLRVD